MHLLFRVVEPMLELYVAGMSSKRLKIFMVLSAIPFTGSFQAGLGLGIKKGLIQTSNNNFKLSYKDFLRYH